MKTIRVSALLPPTLLLYITRLTSRSFHIETGTKRKNPSTPFSFSQTTVSTLALQAEEAALKKIEVEQAEALKNKLPDFWLPSLTPTHTAGPPPQTLEEVQAQVDTFKTVCRGGGQADAHPLA